MFFSRRRSCQILVIFKLSTAFPTRCNRETSSFAVTPHKKLGFVLNITKILQLRRNSEEKSGQALTFQSENY